MLAVRHSLPAPAAVLAAATLLLASTTIAQPAVTDTTLVLGGPDRWDGRFEDAQGQPCWHGWTHADLYGEPGEAHWHVSDHQPIAGQSSLWCGTWYDNACADGYGNSWNDAARFTRPAAHPDQPTTVRLQATVRVDSEPGYDYLHVQARRGFQYEDLIAPIDGTATVTIDETVTFLPADYVTGQWSLRVLARSDAAWSDEDCLWDTAGFARLDDVTVTVDGTVVSEEDFESGTSAHWDTVSQPIAGDFACLRQGLDDLDPDHDNPTWQVTFVDDGEVVPGTGGTPCDTWCYGPGGWVLHPDGGLGDDLPMGPLGLTSSGIWNGVASPALAWPVGADAGELAFDVHAHALHLACGVLTYGWTLRATGEAEPAALDTVAWAPTRWSVLDEETLPPGPGYHRVAVRVDQLLPPDTRWVQVRFEVHEAGPWCWGPYVDDPTPSPYLDNVAVRAWAAVTVVTPDNPPGASPVALHAAPNPFNPRVTVRWTQPQAGPATLAVYDARGRRVRDLVDAERPAGTAAVTWDGRDASGRALPSGLYLLRLRTGAGGVTRAVSLIR